MAAPWWVAFLTQVEEDFDELARGDSSLPGRAKRELLNAFQDPFRISRLEATMKGHSPSDQLLHLRESAFPQSFRLQILRDYRATFWCFPTARHVIVTHFFSKSNDPQYRRAVQIHDRRLSAYFTALRAYLDG